MKRFAWAGIICALCMAVLALMSYPGIGVIRTLFIQGTNYIGLSRICGFGLLSILVYLLPIEPNYWRRKTFWIFILILFLALMISGSRGPLIATIVSLILFFLLSIRKIYPSLIIERFALFLGFFCFFVGFILSFIGKRYFTTLFYRFEKILNNVDNSASTRLSLYQSAINQWTYSPIWGGGPGQFGVTFTGEDIELYPHNIFLEIASENGLFGLIPFCAMLGIAIKNGLSYVYSYDRSTKIVARYLLVMFCYTLLNAMISDDIPGNSLLFAIIGLLGVINHFKNDDN
ncbi:MAG: O-antigen ligase family protein [Crenarchaeota archaeon]|nr:O-antigen ligase family protein [Thermoproteota archaeon]